MKNIVTIMLALFLGVCANAQWKAQTAETFEKTYRMAFIVSKGGGETLRIMRDVTPGSAQKGANPYDQISGQVLLNKNVGTEYKVHTIVLRFDESTKLFIHQPADLKQGWDASAGRYIIESDWQIWRRGDTRNRGAATPGDKGSNLKKEVIDLLKSSGKVNCQIILLHKMDDAQTTVSADFVLQNSTKSINYLFL